MRLQEARKDYYRRLAKEEGYRSRAAFKLLEAVKKYDLIREGERVVDLGAAPGGWAQVASHAVGPAGIVIAIDLDRVKSLGLGNVMTLQQDIYDEEIAGRVRDMVPGGQVDVLLADLSPKITGAWDLDHQRQIDLAMRALELGDALLRPGGNAMIKIFDGERLAEIRKAAGEAFSKVMIVKPRASRKESSELYLVCLEVRGGRGGGRPSVPS